MEEEPNEYEQEERLYAMLHHVDETQLNVNTDSQYDAARIVESVPRSTVRRYWRTSTDLATSHPKANTPKDAPAPAYKNPTPSNGNLTTVNKNTTPNTNNTKPKEEKREIAEATVDLSLFQSPAMIIKKNIEILDHENDSFLLESSDEDEVVEVELPPKPTITIESSDEDEVCIISKPYEPAKDQNKNNVPGNATPNMTDREISASPVPSVVSSVSDDFIRGDCIALNISSRHPDNHSFDFSLHGSDLLGQATPAKKKKKKKSKEAVTSTPVATGEKPSNSSAEICFATPKSKSKERKQKTKYTVSEKSVPSADIYDSDSNQSAIEPIKGSGIFTVTEKSLPSVDIYDSDSSQPENTNKSKSLQQNQGNESSDRSPSLDKHEGDSSINLVQPKTNDGDKTNNSIVDLTENDNYITLNSTGICENIVMANVTGFKESEDYGDETINHSDAPKFGSTKVPQILFDNLDFDNLKGKDKVCKRRRYSLTTLRAEMEKFYNESWGGENFNHREIQKYMSRDKSLWVIDPKDRMPSIPKRKVTCNYCNRAGHRDDACRLKQPVCHMCGSVGHYEPRCPSKICVNCGSPNYMYSTMCRNCCSWGHVRCAECGQAGHPASHCPDIWRRYHNTISSDMPLAENRQTKKHSQLYCSGCTRRGHLVHTCRLALPFSGLPINSPYVALYRPVYLPRPDTVPVSPAVNNRGKRQSKSPTVHETHQNKKKNMTITEIETEKPKPSEPRPRKNSQGKTPTPDETKTLKETPRSVEAPRTQTTVEPAPDFIPITSTNHDKRGQMIQDNEVSDTSDVVTSARIYVPTDVIDRLKTAEGGVWLKENVQKHNIIIDNADITSFLSIKGKLDDQEAFQRELRDWAKQCANKESAKSDTEGDATLESENDQSGYTSNIPKNRNNVLRKLTKALDSLKSDLGDPKDIYKELNYLQNRHEQLLKQKIISPQQLSNNRDHINEMLKKLNMVLLGQAGLAEGSKHIKELHTLHEKLTNYRQKNIPANMRKKIGQHYHSIFTAIPRDDYADLLNMYSRKGKMLKKRYKDKLQLAKKRKKQKTNINPVAVSQTFPNIKKNVENQNSINKENTHSRKASEHITIGKLTFYHRRIMNSRPADSGLKKMRLELARKLHSHISSLYRNENMSSKAYKKVKRVQEQAAMFLSNV